MFDADLGSDDYIGTLNIPIESIKDKTDQWYDLIGARNASIHIRLHWFYLSSDRSCLQAMPTDSSHTLATSLLIVYIERAEQLPSTQHGKTLEPHAFCSVKIDNYEEKTAVVKNSSNPSWRKSFMFMLVNVEQSVLQVDINDSNNHSRPIGSVEISIKDLMDEKHWTRDQPYPISGALANSANTKLHMKLQLQAMTPLRPSIESTADQDPRAKKSQVQLHLIDKHADRTVVNEKAAMPPPTKITGFRRLFSSCLKSQSGEKNM